MCDAALARAFRFLGKRWNGILLGTLVQGPAGFAQLRRAVPGISDSVLSERLSELCAAGLVERTVDAGPPVSVTYQVTGSRNGAGTRPARAQHLGLRQPAGLTGARFGRQSGLWLTS